MSQSKTSAQQKAPVSSQAAPVRKGLGRGGAITARFQAPENLSRQIEQAHQSFEQTSSKIVETERNIKQKKFEQDQLTGTQNLVQKDINELAHKQDKLRHAIASAQQSAKAVAIRRDAVEKELENMKKNLPRRGGGGIEDQIASVDAQIKKLDFERQTSTLPADREKQITQEINKLREAKVSFAHVEERNEQLRKLRRDIDRHEGEASKAKEELSALDAEEAKLQKEKEEIATKIRTVQSEIAQLNKQLETLQGQIKSTKTELKTAKDQLSHDRQTFYEKPAEASASHAPAKPAEAEADMPKMQEIMTDKSAKYMLDKATASTSKHTHAQAQQQQKQKEQAKKVPYADEIAICTKLSQALQTIEKKMFPNKDNNNKKQKKGDKKQNADKAAAAEPSSEEAAAAAASTEPAAAEAEPLPATTPLPRFSLEKLLEFERVSIAAPLTLGAIAECMEQLRLRKEYFYFMQERKTGVSTRPKPKPKKQPAAEKAADAPSAAEEKHADATASAEEQAPADAAPEAVVEETKPVEVPAAAEEPKAEEKVEEAAVAQVLEESKPVESVAAVEEPKAEEKAEEAAAAVEESKPAEEAPVAAEEPKAEEKVEQVAPAVEESKPVEDAPVASEEPKAEEKSEEPAAAPVEDTAVETPAAAEEKPADAHVTEEAPAEEQKPAEPAAEEEKVVEAVAAEAAVETPAAAEVEAKAEETAAPESASEPQPDASS